VRECKVDVRIWHVREELIYAGKVWSQSIEALDRSIHLLLPFRRRFI